MASLAPASKCSAAVSGNFFQLPSSGCNVCGMVSSIKLFSDRPAITNEVAGGRPGHPTSIRRIEGRKYSNEVESRAGNGVASETWKPLTSFAIPLLVP